MSFWIWNCQNYSFKTVYVKNVKISFSSWYVPHKAERIQTAGKYVLERENVCFKIKYLYMTSNIEVPVAERKIKSSLNYALSVLPVRPCSIYTPNISLIPLKTRQSICL